MTLTATEPEFASSDGLRALLDRLHCQGPAAWRTDTDATALMTYAVDKYGALARRHGLDPDDAAVAAWEVLRTDVARTADDPWGVVTHAVRLSLIAEERAQGLLCSPYKTRRAAALLLHDAERFSDRETPVTEYHPAFRLAPLQELLFESEGEAPQQGMPTTAYAALDTTAEIFIALGWPEVDTRACFEYVADRLIETGNRPSAHEALRRDHYARALLDLDADEWATFLRLVLGNPNPDLVTTWSGRGLLQRLLVGDTEEDLLSDLELVREITRNAPRRSYV